MCKVPVVFQTFQNPHYGKFRVTVCDGEPWFLAEDICTYLEMRNVQASVDCLEDDEKRVCEDLTLVSEQGVYSLLIDCERYDARHFKWWVVHEIIPLLTQMDTSAYLKSLQKQILDIQRTLDEISEQAPFWESSVGNVESELDSIKYHDMPRLEDRVSTLEATLSSGKRGRKQKPKRTNDSEQSLPDTETFKF